MHLFTTFSIIRTTLLSSSSSVAADVYLTGVVVWAKRLTTTQTKQRKFVMVNNALTQAVTCSGPIENDAKLPT